MHRCEYCSKHYTRKSSFTRHVIVCEILHQTKREKQCAAEESTDIPTTRQLYSIIQELAMKCQAMDERMTSMQAWIHKKKQKWNACQWLNANQQPNTTIEEWYKHEVQVLSDDNEQLIEQTFCQTIQTILRRHLHDTINNPIYAFSQKSGILYCFSNEWAQMEPHEFLLLLKHVHAKMVKALCEWHTTNIEKINQSEKMQLLYNKTLLKLMSVSFQQETPLTHKIKQELFHYIKKDVKTIVEFEYEF